MSSHPAAAPAAETPERLAFYERISRHHLTPLWRSLARLVTPEPASGCQPAAWSFADIRAAMIEAGTLITAQEAERRRPELETGDARRDRPGRALLVLRSSDSGSAVSLSRGAS